MKDSNSTKDKEDQQMKTPFPEHETDSIDMCGGGAGFFRAMKTLITIFIMLVSVGCGEAGYQISSLGSPIEKPEENIVGSYEAIHEGHFIHKLVFLENGKTESFLNTQGNEHPCKLGSWKIKGHRPYEMERVFWIQEKETVVFQTHPNGDLTKIGLIKTTNERGERISEYKPLSLEDQDTYKKIK